MAGAGERERTRGRPAERRVDNGVYGRDVAIAQSESRMAFYERFARR